jgi:hypothetical protein
VGIRITYLSAMLYRTISLREHRDEILDVLTIVRSQLESSLDDAAIALRL